MRSFVGRLLRTYGRAATVTLHDRLDAIEQQNAELASTQTALLLSNIQLLETLDRVVKLHEALLETNDARRLTLAELPPPPRDRTGWPWTAESAQVDDVTPAGFPWPRITVVTPSYNQGNFLEATIRSMLLQGYPNLECIVVDGGSTDDSREIIDKYRR